MALTRISSAGIQTSPTFSGDVRIGLGATLESSGNAYVTGITTLGIGATGDVYLYNPSNSALSGTENSAYGWKAKTYCGGLQVNSTLYLSRSGSNGLSLNYNNATGSYITANSGFMNISVPHGPPMRFYASCFEFRHNHNARQSAFFNTNGAIQLNHNGDKRFETTSTGAIITGIATVTGNLSVGGTVTYEDVTNVDSIGIITARSDIIISSALPRITLNDTNNESDFDIKNENGSFRIRDLDNPTDRYRINSSGGTIHEFFGAADFSSQLTVGGNLNVTGGATISGVTTTTSFGLTTEDLFATGITTANQAFRVNGNSSGTGLMPFVVRHGGYQGIQTSLFTSTLNNYPELVLQNEWGGNWNTTGPWKLKWTSPNEGDAGPAGDGRVLSELMPAIGNAGNLSGFRLRATDGSTGLKNVFLLHPSDSRFYINNSSGQTEAFRINAAGIGITNYIYHAGNIPNDTNTRFGFGGNDTIDFETNGTQRLLINNSGASVTGNFGASGNISLSGSFQMPDALQHMNDTTTQIRFPGPGLFSVETSGVQAFKINQGGHLELGRDYSSNPQNGLVGITTIRGHRVNEAGDYVQLHFQNSTVSGKSTASIRAFRDGGNYKTGLSFYTHNSNSSGGTGTERLRIDSLGNFAMNGTGSTNAKLDVRTDLDPSNGVIIYSRNNAQYGNGAFHQMDINGVGNWSFGMPDNTDAFTIVDGAGNSGSEKLRITSTGRVGIGTTNPIAQLDVNVGSSVTAFNIEGTEGQLFSVTNNLSSGSIFAVNDITGLPSIDVNADGTIQLAPRGTGELVGIGTTSPTSKLHVVGDTLVTGISTFSDDVNLSNDKKIKFGTMGFQIYQNTSSSNNAIIQQSASGQFLRLITNGGQLSVEADYVQFRNSANSTTTAQFDADGATNLFHNSNLKFFTKTDGAGVTGDLSVSGTVDGTGAVGSRLFQQDSFRNMIAGTNAGLAISLTTSPPPLSNILIGCEAGKRIRSQCYTVAIGVNAGRCIAGGSGQDTFVGSNAGQKAGCCGGTGGNNAYFGYGSGICGYNPIANTYLGYNAGRGHGDSTGGTGGTCNVAVGYHAASSIRAGNNNVLIGRYVGASHSTASNNIALGNAALFYTLSGGGNIALGSQVLEKNLTGFLNVAISCNTLYNNTTGACNIAIGHNALYCNTTFSTNIAIGRMAGYKATCGPNLMIGEHAGCILNGPKNTIVGQNAGKQSTEATGNSFFGQCAGYNNSTGDCNVYAGSKAGFGNTTGSYNIALGSNAGPQNCGATGCYNISLGYLSGSCNETASDTISIGQYANYCNKAGANIAIGRKSSFHDDVATNGFNVAIGDCAFMGGTNMGTRKHNVAIGIQAGGSSTAGSGNVFVGCYSGYCNGGGSVNVYISRKAGYFNKTGHDNVMIGDCAGFSGGDQNCNVFIGKYAGYSNSGDDNIAIGLKAGCSIATGGCNIAIGQHAGMKFHAGSKNIAIGKGIAVFSNVTGGDNILMGDMVARRITSGAYNTFLGSSAGRYVTSGSRNIVVGVQASYCLSTGNDNIGLGACSNRCLASGLDNISIGRCSGYLNTTKSGNVAIGHSAGFGVRGANNVSIGATAGPANSCTDTHDNVFIGSRTGTAYTGGCNIIAIGINAGASSCCAACGCNNIHIGQNTGCKTQSGDNNITIGCRAGRNLTTGRCNIFMGLYAGGTVSTTSSVLAIGNRAAQNAAGPVIAIGCCAGGNTGGGSAGGIFIGRCAGRYANASDSPNIIMGANAGRSITNGLNIIIGSGAAYPATSACRNIGLGGQSHQKLTTGDGNIALGTFALAGNTTGCCNIAIGDNSGAMNCGATGSCNVTISVGTGHSLTTGSDNIFVGRDAGYEVKSSSRNVIIGCGAGRCLRDGGGSNTFIGDQAGHYMGRCDCSTNVGNTFIGHSAGKNVVNSCHAVAIGYQAAHGVANSKLHASHTINIGCRAGCKMEGGHSIINIGRMAGASNSGGTFNINMGYQAGYNNLTGGNNFYGGYLAGFCNKTGGSNIAIGQNAFKCGTSGTTNIFMLNATGCNANGHSNIALGYVAFRCNSSGSHNIALGACAMRGCDTPANGTGCCNVMIGKATGCYISAGNKNTVIGVQAGYGITTGSCNVILGVDAGSNLTSNTHNVIIGPFANVPSGCSGTMTIGCCTMNWITGFNDGSVTINHGNANASGLLRISKNGNGASELRFDTAAANTASVYLGDDEQLRIRYGSTEHTRFKSDGSITSGNLISSGIVTASSFSGDGSNLSGITASSLNISSFTADSKQNIFAGGTCSGCNLKTDGDTHTNACFNIMLGACAGKSMACGDHNVLIGQNAGCSLVQGTFGCNALANVFIGKGTGASAEHGCFSVAIGCGTLESMKGFGCNIAFGRKAGQYTCTGTHNFFAGNYAAKYNCNGQSNIAIGERSISCNTSTGGNNIALGQQAMVGSSTTTNNTGGYNVAIGQYAGKLLTSGANNVFLKSATSGCISGNYNFIVHGGTNFTSGSNNVILGEYAAHKCGVTGSHNFIAGACAGCAISSGSNNILIGKLAARSGVLTGCDNIVIGSQAAYANMTNASCNIIFGRDTAVCLATGQQNIAIGARAGYHLDSGAHNIFIGENAGAYITPVTSGTGNIAIGNDVDVPSPTGDDQLAIGCNNCRWITGNSSFKVGISSDITSPRAELHVEGSVHASRFFQNPTALDTSESFPADGGAAVNGGVYGPYTINTGVTLTIGDGSTFTVV